MNKPVIKENSFSVEDIHKIREYHYEQTKNLSSDEFIKEINERAKKVRNDIKKAKKKKVAI